MKQTMKRKKRRTDVIWTAALSLLCLVYIYPIALILFNSLKTERAITTTRIFELPDAEERLRAWKTSSTASARWISWRPSGTAWSSRSHPCC